MTMITRVGKSSLLDWGLWITGVATVIELAWGGVIGLPSAVLAVVIEVTRLLAVSCVAAVIVAAATVGGTVAVKVTLAPARRASLATELTLHPAVKEPVASAIPRPIPYPIS